MWAGRGKSGIREPKESEMLRDSLTCSIQHPGRSDCSLKRTIQEYCDRLLTMGFEAPEARDWQLGSRESRRGSSKVAFAWSGSGAAGLDEARLQIAHKSTRIPTTFDKDRTE